MKLRTVLSLVVLAAAVAPAGADAPARPMRFDFGPAASVAPGWIAVEATATFDADRGYGFEPGSPVQIVDRGVADPLRRDFATGEAPFSFSVIVPREGNHRVTVILGDAAGQSTTTIHAELRRLMLDRVPTRQADFRIHRFIVNTRTPRIDAATTVRLKEREKTSEARAWDDRLTLEFCGPRPAICALEIEPVDDVPTLYLLGDSTVTDQPAPPYAGWGQMLPRYLTDAVAVANHAQSGESYAGALAAGRVAKVASLLRPGDPVLLQFGHNDQKARGAAAGAFLDYTEGMRRTIAMIREKGGVPVLVTSMHRRRFDAGGRVVDTHGDYPEAVRRVAAELRVPLIDLHAASATLYEAFGPEGSAALFVEGDLTHHTAFGAGQLAKCVLMGLREARLPVAAALAPDFEPFDPARPDAPVAEPAAVPVAPAARPDGS